MPPPYCYEYPRPAVTVDLVAFALSGDGLRVLLIRRKHEPFTGRLALPGGFLDLDEPIETAARRELREETGFEVAGPVELIGVFGAPGRDPRGRTISLAHAAAVRGPLVQVAGGDDAAEAAWLDPHSTRGLAFDHDAILRAALGWLERGVVGGTLGLALLPIEFEDDDVKLLFCELGRSAQAALGWRRRMVHAGRIVTRKSGRPPYRIVEA
jgi:8-oxo-dGTP diphosphatase